MEGARTQGITCADEESRGLGEPSVEKFMQPPRLSRGKTKERDHLLPRRPPSQAVLGPVIEEFIPPQTQPHLTQPNALLTPTPHRSTLFPSHAIASHTTLPVLSHKKKAA